MRMTMRDSIGFVFWMSLCIIGLHVSDGRCVETLNEISLTEAALALSLDPDSSSSKSELAERRYILCPNTVFRVGRPREMSITLDGLDEDSYVAGSLPLLVLNPNLSVQCGEHGRSSDKCIFFGGEHQVLSAAHSNTDRWNDISNFQLVGVTLESSVDVAFALQAVKGKGIKILDCVFRNHGLGSFVAYFDAREARLEGSRSIQLRSIRKPPLSDPLLSSNVATSGLEITINHTAFFNNTSELAVVGTVGAGIRWEMHSTVLQQNSIPERVDGTGSIVWLTGGEEVSFSSNCWINNSYALGPILINHASGALIWLPEGGFKPRLWDGNFVRDYPRTQPLGCTNSLFYVPTDVISLGEALTDGTYECIHLASDLNTTATCESTMFSSGSSWFPRSLWVFATLRHFLLLLPVCIGFYLIV